MNDQEIEAELWNMRLEGKPYKELRAFLSENGFDSERQDLFINKQNDRELLPKARNTNKIRDAIIYATGVFVILGSILVYYIMESNSILSAFKWLAIFPILGGSTLIWLYRKNLKKSNTN